ncbi:MAG: TetR family transcriptional regulator [Nocardia sp.]|uniref:TetR/AcrR family transcriptional regulator n=1 Tax=Nocardia sp. TaxID=1821 RepID=UPI0026391BAC|nr:TetR/AcrR family transcriptional regulator [Nocardia sp.]MCU1646107.1 TetR family transcriptional regulator [Nocardia sp.]
MTAGSGEAPEATQAEGRRRTNARRTLVTRELLDRATSLFAEKGYETTTLKDVADAVGISRPALYHYVSSKEDLLAMLVEQIGLNLAESLTALRQRTDLSAEGKLRELSGTLVRQRAESPNQFRVLDRSEALVPEPLRTLHRQARRTVLTELAGLIEEGIAAGEFKRLDPQVAAFTVLGMCNWVAWWYHPGIGIEIDAVAAQISQSAVDVLIVRGPQGPESVGAALATMSAGLETLKRLLPEQV